MKTRVLAAIPIALILIAALILQSWVLFGLVVFLSFVAQHEMLKAVSSNGTKTINCIPYIVDAVIPAVLLFFGAISSMFIIFLVFAAAVFALFLVAMFSKRFDYCSFRNTVVAMIYPEIFFMFLFFIVVDYTNFEFWGTNPVLILLAIVPAIFSDCLALFVGKAFGKRKLCPEISPKKTVAGAIGGVIGGVIAGIVIYILFVWGVTGLSFDNMPVWLCIVIGAVVAFVSQLGDLSASFIKRHYGIKDFGTLIPGHGGILDRVDSWLFAFPVVYLFAFFINF